MEVKVKQLYHFDEVFDSQKSFRIVLEAMSNPLRKLSREKEKDKLYGEYPHILVLAMTLLYNETTYCLVYEK